MTDERSHREQKRRKAKAEVTAEESIFGSLSLRLDLDLHKADRLFPHPAHAMTLVMTHIAGFG